MVGCPSSQPVSTLLLAHPLRDQTRTSVYTHMHTHNNTRTNSTNPNRRRIEKEKPARQKQETRRKERRTPATQNSKQAEAARTHAQRTNERTKERTSERASERTSEGTKGKKRHTPSNTTAHVDCQTHARPGRARRTPCRQAREQTAQTRQPNAPNARTLINHPQQNVVASSSISPLSSSSGWACPGIDQDQSIVLPTPKLLIGQPQHEQRSPFYGTAHLE